MQIFICLQKQMVCGRSFDTYLNLFHVNTCTKINRQIPIATSDDAANDSLTKGIKQKPLRVNCTTFTYLPHVYMPIQYCQIQDKN